MSPFVQSRNVPFVLLLVPVKLQDTVVDDSGAYRFQGVTPGEYRRLAGEEVERGALSGSGIRKGIRKPGGHCPC